jgi:cell division protein FtsW (lipid II flippase)
VSVATAEPALKKRARGQEAQLLVLALLVVVGAYVLLGLAEDPQIPTGTWLYSGALAGLALVAHLAVRRFAPLADPVLLPCAFLLNGIGLVLIQRVDDFQGSDLVVAQTRWTVVAVGLFAATLLLLSDHRDIARFRYTAGLVTVVLLLLPLLPGIGAEVQGARIWVRLGPLSFQPGEIAKLAMVVFLAGYLAEKRTLLAVATNRVGPFLLPAGRHLAPVLAAAAGAIGIQVLQNDLGMSLLFFGAFLGMLYIGTGRIAYPAIGMLFFSAGAFLAYTLFSHVQVRFQIWIDPFADFHGIGFQIVQAMFAFGTGGVTGTGLGLGYPQIPEAATDAIFAVLGEELGLLGGTAVLLTYALIVTKGFKAAIAAGDDVGTLLASGLALLLGLQVFVIIGGISRLVPLTGITLPLMSYGGSSLVANYILLAGLVRVSDSGRRRIRGGT